MFTLKYVLDRLIYYFVWEGFKLFIVLLLFLQICAVVRSMNFLVNLKI